MQTDKEKIVSLLKKNIREIDPMGEVIYLVLGQEEMKKVI